MSKNKLHLYFNFESVELSIFTNPSDLIKTSLYKRLNIKRSSKNTKRSKCCKIYSI